MTLFADEQIQSANLALNVSAIALMLLQLYLFKTGWTRRNGWQPPCDRRKGGDRRRRKRKPPQK